MLVVFHQKQPTVIKQSSVVNYLMQSVTSTWLHITVRFILGYVVRRLVIIIIRKRRWKFKRDMKIVLKVYFVCVLLGFSDPYYEPLHGS